MEVYMSKSRLLEKNRPILIDFILYTMTAAVIVLSSWAIDLHKYDLGITISRYIALRPWTYFLYLVMAVIMISLGVIYVFKSKMGIVKTVLYLLTFAFILGCAILPFNRDWNRTIANMHDFSSYGIMTVGTLSLIWMLIKPKNLKQRVFSILAVGYAAFFILCYIIIKWDFFINTIFIWENTFIYIFLVELYIEYSRKKS